MPVEGYSSECAGEGKTRVITSDGYEGERRRMAAKMRSEAGKEEYKKRKETVEWLFGNIKQNLKVIWGTAQFIYTYLIYLPTNQSFEVFMASIFSFISCGQSQPVRSNKQLC